MKKFIRGEKSKLLIVDRVVGQRVRARRMELGMSQSTLASGLGVSFQQVQKYESGKNRISSGRLWQIAQTLQVQVNYFFEGLDKISRP